MEEWKDIKGYEGIYQASTEGRVKSLERTVVYKDGRKKVIKERLLTPHKNTNGHLNFRLSKNGVIMQLQAHRIIAETFIPNSNNYCVVHHIDHNPYNNKIENLEWMSDKKHRGLHIKERRSKTVYQYTKNGKLVAIWPSATEAAEKLGIGHISECCYGKRKTAGGYIWSYKQLTPTVS